MSDPRGSDPEAVIRQAMRAMAGGRRDEPSRHPQQDRRGSGRRPHWSTTQILLLVAIVGVLLGMAAGFAVLLTG